ncbi:MAG: cyclase family protein [Methanobacteriaceae archaeon]|nr:cyclase family protein [Methanobacteriaceae archaeon]
MIELSHQMYNKMPVYPGDPPFLMEVIKKHQKDGYLLYKFMGNMHTGTHLDAPYHFHPHGRKISDLKLVELIKTALIIDVKSKKIKSKHLKSVEEDEIIIFRTKWSLKWDKEEYFSENPYLSHECADQIVEMKIRGIGIDSPSIDTPGNMDNHFKLLSNDIWIVENLTNLDQINSERFRIYIIPPLFETEASPVRVFADLNNEQ